MPTEQDARSRRTVVGLAAVVGTGLLAGCGGLDAVTGTDREQLTDARRDRILDRYASGRAARRAASEHWAQGSDAWQLNFFREAATEWTRAGRRFAESYRQFARADRECRDVAAERAHRVCADARNYSRYMRSSAEAHAEAADAYAAGNLETGEEHLDRAWRYYQSALDHEVRGPSHLEAALDTDQGETDG